MSNFLLSLLLLSVNTIGWLYLLHLSSYTSADAFIVPSSFLLDNHHSSSSNSLLPRTSQVHKTFSTKSGNKHSSSNKRSNSNENDQYDINVQQTSEDNTKAKVIDFLKRENQGLKHEIQLLQDTNKMLQMNSNIVIETFEGEGRIPNKWFKDDNEEDEEKMDFILQQEDDETDEYWLNNSTNIASTSFPEQSMLDEECLISDNDSGIISDACPTEPDVSFQSALRDRALWLVGLLLLQSFSGIILSRNEAMIQNHPFIIYFLTMLVGAGGNAGNQASVRVIRGLALGTLNDATQRQFLSREFKMAFCLSGILSLAGFVRAFMFKTPFPETFAITSALCCIVLISVCLGAVLPLFLKKVGVDPAHSSTSIQVLMDVLGVFITVLVCSLLLDSALGQFVISKLSF